MKEKADPASDALKAQVAERLRVARMAFNLTAAEVAYQIGVTPQALSKWERGDRFPSELAVVRFADLTGCTTDWIYRGRTTSRMPPMMEEWIEKNASHLVQAANQKAIIKPRRSRLN